MTKNEETILTNLVKTLQNALRLCGIKKEIIAY